MPTCFRVKLAQRTRDDELRATELFFTPPPPFKPPVRPNWLYMTKGQRKLGAGQACLIRGWFESRTPFNIRFLTVNDGVAMFVLVTGGDNPLPEGVMPAA